MNRESSYSIFTQSVIYVVQAIPVGKVVSYGQVALYAGAPKAARQVGWILRRVGNQITIPWWRVVNNTGRITIKGNWLNTAVQQKKLLKNEGVEVSADFTLDIERHRFKAGDDLLKLWRLPGGYREAVLAIYGL